MNSGQTVGKLRHARHLRVRKRVIGTSDRPRLCVFRTAKHIYAQIIDDSRHHTLAAASTMEPAIRNDGSKKTKIEWSKHVGTLIAKKALDKGITKVVFDRGGYKYHGRIKTLAEAAREGRLVF